jgi:hypothetical protein
MLGCGKKCAKFVLRSVRDEEQRLYACKNFVERIDGEPRFLNTNSENEFGVPLWSSDEKAARTDDHPVQQDQKRFVAGNHE